MQIGRLLLGALFAWSAATAATNFVRIETGLIEGTAGSTADVHVFRGISYAAPPVGDLRWRPPEPAAAWNGVRPAREFSHACVQDTTPGRGPKLLVDATVQQISEDCLYLNVWTTANSAKEKRDSYRSSMIVAMRDVLTGLLSSSDPVEREIYRLLYEPFLHPLRSCAHVNFPGARRK